MKRLLLVVLLLVGCAEWKYIIDAAQEEGAEIADEELKDAIWLVCRASTRGAHYRMFKGEPDKAAALELLCGDT